MNQSPNSFFPKNYKKIRLIKGKKRLTRQLGREKKRKHDEGMGDGGERGGDGRWET